MAGKKIYIIGQAIQTCATKEVWSEYSIDYWKTINHTYPELWAYTGKHNTETNLDIIWKQIHW